MPRPNVRWNVVIDVPTVLLSAIKLTQSPTRVLGAVERYTAYRVVTGKRVPLVNDRGILARAPLSFIDDTLLGLPLAIRGNGQSSHHTSSGRGTRGGAASTVRTM